MNLNVNANRAVSSQIKLTPPPKPPRPGSLSNGRPVTSAPPNAGRAQSMSSLGSQSAAQGGSVIQKADPKLPMPSGAAVDKAPPQVQQTAVKSYETTIQKDVPTAPARATPDRIAEKRPMDHIKSRLSKWRDSIRGSLTGLKGSRSDVGSLSFSRNEGAEDKRTLDNSYVKKADSAIAATASQGITAEKKAYFAQEGVRHKKLQNISAEALKTEQTTAKNMQSAVNQFTFINQFIEEHGKTFYRDGNVAEHFGSIDNFERQMQSAMHANKVMIEIGTEFTNKLEPAQTRYREAIEKFEQQPSDDNLAKVEASYKEMVDLFSSDTFKEYQQALSFGALTMGNTTALFGNVVSDAKANNPQFKESYKAHEGTGHGQFTLDLNANTIVAVQRLPRHTMLLADLLSKTPAASKAHASLQTALDHTGTLAEHVNRGVKQFTVGYLSISENKARGVAKEIATHLPQLFKQFNEATTPTKETATPTKKSMLGFLKAQLGKYKDASKRDILIALDNLSTRNPDKLMQYLDKHNPGTNSGAFVQALAAAARELKITL